VLILAFDTATDVASSALVDDGELLGERTSVARTLLEDLDALLRRASARPGDVDAIAVGTGPGSFTSTRMGIAVARGLALALDIPVAGASTLDALAASGVEIYPVIDARRGEVFVPGPRVVAPANIDPPLGAVCVGDGARRYRDVIEAAGAVVAPDESELHGVRARFVAELATGFGPAELVEPVYVRVPDVDLPRA
jgi:tRNA threonylcarbamoyladenosine biosynthesis protein TsaB